MEKIKDKVEEIETYLEELESIIPSDFEAYEQDFKSKAACERYFEKIIEAVVDLAFLVIKDKKLKTAEDDKGAFDILAESKIIQKELAERLKDAKGMRNILAHEYGAVDDSIVFDAITGELEKDVREFIDVVSRV